MDDSEPKLLQRILDPVLGFFENIGTTVSLTFQTVAWLFRPPFRASQMLAAMDYIGVQSTFLVGLTGLFSGMVVALQSVYALKQFSAEANVGGIVAVSLMREVSPVFSALMITARAGSGMAAELGNMRVTEQIDAITTMGVSPVQYLLSPRLLAGVMMGPLLCMLYSTIGMIGCYLVAVAWLGGDWGFFLRSIHDFARPRDLFMGLVKGAIFGFLIASIACRHGYFASGGARGVGMATTRAVVESCVAILVANYVLTQVMLGDM
ncbi:ABC transporter permease [Polyangium spumosum]|uniref:MlaE family lipid ABC transporter permease subunit n=1 Tax=Polyangium spumosum TaxID=889282 RepID=A0A6N7PV89_9BACT|nr:MlaE family lipid ABC transporter permease subunit [Polyangium spumosum]